MTKSLFRLDPSKPFHHQERLGHNRWHPDIPPVETIRPGETFRVDCRDWFDGAVHNDESAEDVLTAPFHIGHPLSGPFRVEGAKPGDLLVVDIVDVAPMSDATAPGDLAGQGWGYTGIFAPAHGGGFLHEHFPDAHKAIWDFQDGRATSRHIPGVSFQGAPHPGVMGTAPSPGPDQRTRDYVAKRTKEGLSKKEILRCLKRAIIREVYRVLCLGQAVLPTGQVGVDDLKARRVERQLSQAQVAEKLGCVPARISDIETGKRPLPELRSAYEELLKSA